MFSIYPFNPRSIENQYAKQNHGGYMNVNAVGNKGYVIGNAVSWEI